jgi:hypothetical protein
MQSPAGLVVERKQSKPQSAGGAPKGVLTLRVRCREGRVGVRIHMHKRTHVRWDIIRS